MIHCLSGNLLRAMLGFGMLDDARVQPALAYHAAVITGEGVERWYATTPGPGFRCAMNYGDPCAWGAVKAVLALARVPAERRTPAVAKALDQGASFLLSLDPYYCGLPDGPRNQAKRLVVKRPQLRSLTKSMISGRYPWARHTTVSAPP
jgi:hypothetical protein